MKLQPQESPHEDGKRSSDNYDIMVLQFLATLIYRYVYRDFLSSRHLLYVYVYIYMYTYTYLWYRVSQIDLKMIVVIT